MKNSFKNIKK